MNTEKKKQSTQEDWCKVPLRERWFDQAKQAGKAKSQDVLWKLKHYFKSLGRGRKVLSRVVMY